MLYLLSVYLTVLLATLPIVLGVCWMFKPETAGIRQRRGIRDRAEAGERHQAGSRRSNTTAAPNESQQTEGGEILAVRRKLEPFR